MFVSIDQALSNRGPENWCHFERERLSAVLLEVSMKIDEAWE